LTDQKEDGMVEVADKGKSPGHKTKMPLRHPPSKHLCVQRDSMPGAGPIGRSSVTFIGLLFSFSSLADIMVV